MGKTKFDRAELARLIREGKSQKEIAEVFFVTPMTICKAAKKIGLTAVRHAAITEPEVSSKQVAQVADDQPPEEVNPEKVKAIYEKLVAVEAGKLNKHRDYFMAKGENPFREALKHLVLFHNQFDTIASLKGK